jgi:hypothetical protein
MNNHSFNEDAVKAQSLDEFKSYCATNHKDLQEVDVIAIYNSIVPIVAKPVKPQVTKGTPDANTK